MSMRRRIHLQLHSCKTLLLFEVQFTICKNHTLDRALIKFGQVSSILDRVAGYPANESIAIGIEEQSYTQMQV